MLQPEVETPSQRRLLTALLPALRRTLLLERQLAGEATTAAMLEVPLDALGYPAVICDARGIGHAANAAARALPRSLPRGSRRGSPARWRGLRPRAAR